MAGRTKLGQHKTRPSSTCMYGCMDPFGLHAHQAGLLIAVCIPVVCHRSSSALIFAFHYMASVVDHRLCIYLRMWSNEDA